MPAKPKTDAHPAPDEIVSSLVKTLNHKQRTAYTFYEREDASEVKCWISTGSTLLDYAIANRRNGGIAFGRITEINGLESTGKSLLSLHMVANAQKMGGIGVILDTEDRLLNKDLCERMGIDWRRTVIANPGTIENCFEHIEKAIIDTRKYYANKDVPVIIVWDSLAATPPQAEIEGDFDPQSQMGLGAKAVARGFRKLTHTIGTESIALVVIQQLRMNMRALPFADPYITPYGKALAYHASTRLRIAQNSKIKNEKDEIIGVLCHAKVIKNSLGPPMREAKFPVIFGYGVDDQQSWYDFLWEKDLITKARGKSKIVLNGEEQLFQTDQWKAFLAQDNNKERVLELLDSLLVIKYEANDPANDLVVTQSNEQVAEI